MPITAKNNICYDLIIIGGGFSAGMILIHFARQLKKKQSSGTVSLSPKIAVISDQLPIGHGAAYQAMHSEFRLNISATATIIDPERANDYEFCTWAALHVEDKTAWDRFDQSYYARKDFARFMDAELSKAYAILSNLSIIHDRVISLEQRSSLYHLKTLDADQEFTAQAVIIAAGNPKPQWPAPIIDKIGEQITMDYSKSIEYPKLIENPWSGVWVGKIKPHETVLFIGTGLTMLDGFSALLAQGHQGDIIALSRNGRLPMHNTIISTDRWPVSESPSPETASQMMHRIRNHIRQRISAGDPWYEGLDDARQVISHWWFNLPDDEKRRLYRHMGSRWNTIRYRTAQHIFDQVKHAQATGQFKIMTGRLKQLINNSTKEKIIAELNNGDHIEVDYVINCTGLARHPLAKELIAQNLAIPDPLNIAIKVNQDLSVVSPNLQHEPTNLFAIGAMTLGSLGDPIGANDIALRAQNFAKDFLSYYKRIKND